MAFVNRVSELATLECEYARSEASFVVIYGRRRVGKTALIREFIKDKRALYYLATEESESQNRESFKSAAADFLALPLLRTARFDRWEDLFSAIVDATTSTAANERTVIVIDEFQYIGKANPAFPSVFQRIWDTQLKELNVMVIICGSLISLMESQALSYDSPLYGRRTAQIRLRQVPFRHYADFFAPNSKTTCELVEFYGVTGGVPKYIELFAQAKDIFEGIDNNVLNSGGFLYDEPNFLLRREVSDIGTYFSIIKVIAAGNHKPSAIASALEVKQTSLSRHFATLMNLDIIEREAPATEKNPEKSKRSLYRIKDNYLRFWFRFVQPNLSFLESGHAELARRSIRKNLIDGHVSYVYEDVCRERVWDLAAEGAWPFLPTRVGRWWDAKNNEIDVVALNEDDKSIAFGECKFWKAPVGANVLHDLEEKSLLVDWNRGAREECYVLFSISGFTDDLRELAAARDDVLLIDDSQ